MAVEASCWVQFTGFMAMSGSFMLISAGPDGVYYSASDGPGTQSNPVIDLTSKAETNIPTIIKEYDDVRLFGG